MPAEEPSPGPPPFGRSQRKAAAPRRSIENKGGCRCQQGQLCPRQGGSVDTLQARVAVRTVAGAADESACLSMRAKKTAPRQGAEGLGPICEQACSCTRQGQALRTRKARAPAIARATARRSAGLELCASDRLKLSASDRLKLRSRTGQSMALGGASLLRFWRSSDARATGTPRRRRRESSSAIGSSAAYRLHSGGAWHGVGPGATRGPDLPKRSRREESTEGGVTVPSAARVGHLRP